MVRPATFIAASAFSLLAAVGSVHAQTVVTSGSAKQTPAVVTTPPAVDNGVANGVAKASGSPSVANGTSNGIVKKPGAPSVGDGVGNGVLKQSTVQQ